MLGELGGVAVREKVAVDLFELFDAELAVGAVFEETLVPLLDLGVAELKKIYGNFSPTSMCLGHSTQTATRMRGHP